MEVRLKPDWDVPIQPPEPEAVPQGHFVGRRRELELLAKGLLRGPRRSIFVWGHRGVGKTSLLYQALFDARAFATDATLVPVILNAAQLEAESHERDSEDRNREGEAETERLVPRQILVNLIRRLYTATLELSLPSDLRQRINDVYEKAVAAEFRERHEEVQATARQVQRHIRISLGASSRLARFVWLASLSSALAFLSWSPLDTRLLNHLVALLIAAPLPLTIFAAIDYSREHSGWFRSSVDASRLYEIDSSLGNLEFDLEQIHSKLARNDFTVIYLIDELDKLSPELVLGVLQYYKTLFTLSAAVFVFVGGEELAQHLAPEVGRAGTVRPKEYTYFSARVYLSRPSTSDLHDFFDAIVGQSRPLSREDDELLSQYRRLVAFDASGDFFDLIQRVRDDIIRYDESGNPIIKLDEPDIEQATRIRMQEAIDSLFDRKYRVDRPSAWRENELVLRALYERAHVIARSYAGESFDDPDDASAPSRALRDFDTLMHDAGALRIVTPGDVELRGRTVAVNEYEYIGSVPSAIGDRLDFLSDYEQEFVDGFRDIEARLRLLARHRSRVRRRRGESAHDSFEEVVAYVEPLGFDALASLGDAPAVYRGLTAEVPPHPYARTAIEEATERVRATDGQLEATLVSLVSNLLASQVSGSRVESIGTQPAHFGEAEFEEVRTDAVARTHLVVVSADERRELLVVEGLEPELVRSNVVALRALASTRRILGIGRPEADFRPKPKSVRTFALDPDHEEASSRALRWAIDWLRK